MPHWYEFEEIVGRAWDRWASDANSYPDFPEAAVDLDVVLPVLGSYFRAMGGPAAVTLSAVKAHSSGHRLSWRQWLGMASEEMCFARRNEESLLLPSRIAYFPDQQLNQDLYFWLTAFLASAAPVPEVNDPLQRDLLHLHHSWLASESLSAELPGLGQRYQRLCKAVLAMRPTRQLPATEASVEALIGRMLGDHKSNLPPMAERWWNWLRSDGSCAEIGQAPAGYRAPLPVPLWGEVLLREPGSAMPNADEVPAVPAGGTANAAKRRAERRELDQPDRDDPLLLSPFEKMLSWTEMVNVNRSVDDDDPASAKQAAEQLDQLALSSHKQEAATRLQMDLDVPVGAAEEGVVEATYRYPEWHYRKQRLMPDYCAVQANIASDTGEDWQMDADMAQRVRRVRRQFEALRPRRELARGEPDGDELDTDAMIRAHCDRIAGMAGSERVFQSWREQARDLAVAILVDVSLSTESWVEDRRVLDVEKEALLALSQGLDACGDEQAIYTFTSRRRHHVDVRTVKAFDEPLSPMVKQRICALRPGLYTRMGAAIRHVGSELAARPNRHRLLLLLTDGKPNDSDHYEGRYAVEDSRRAVQEMRRLGLQLFGVTVDREARQYFPHIFGPGAYSIIQRPAGLARALPQIYRQITSARA